MKYLLWIFCLFSLNFSFAADQSQLTPQNSTTNCELAGAATAETTQKLKKHLAILLDQVVKSGGPLAAPLIDTLVARAHAHPEILSILEGLQEKVEMLLNTKPGTTLINIGFFTEVEDPYHNAESVSQESSVNEVELELLVRNGVLNVVGPELIPERGVTGPVIIPLAEGVGIEVMNYRLKDRLTPPVSAFLISALTVIAMSDPAALNAELKDYRDMMFLPWNQLRAVTLYLMAVVRTAGRGELSLNQAIEVINPKNAPLYLDIKTEQVTEQE